MSQHTYVCPLENCECVYVKQPLPHELPYPPLKWLKPETQDAVFQKRDQDVNHVRDSMRTGFDYFDINEHGIWAYEMRTRLKLAMHLRYLVQTDPLFN